jgi:hypothetical protein
MVTPPRAFQSGTSANRGPARQTTNVVSGKGNDVLRQGALVAHQLEQVALAGHGLNCFWRQRSLEESCVHPVDRGRQR